MEEDKKKDNWEVIKKFKDENGYIDMDKVKDAIPEIGKGLVKKLRDKQEMVVDSITVNDLTSAGLRDKAMSAKVLGEQAMELEQGKPMGNIQVFYIKANN